MNRLPTPRDVARVLQRLQDDDLDGALDAGLMDCDPVVAADPESGAAILAAQRRCAAAWAARDRYRARVARLSRREAERAARRMSAPATTASSGLPPAAAAALARAKARALGKP